MKTLDSAPVGHDLNRPIELDAVEILSKMTGLNGLRLLRQKGFNKPETMHWFMTTADSPGLRNRSALHVATEFYETYLTGAVLLPDGRRKPSTPEHFLRQLLSKNEMQVAYLPTKVLDQTIVDQTDTIRQKVSGLVPPVSAQHSTHALYDEPVKPEHGPDSIWHDRYDKEEYRGLVHRTADVENVNWD